MNNTLNLFSVKLIHTLIWLFMVTAIVYVLYCELADDVNPYTWIVIGLVVAEVLVLLLFGGRCPLTIIARNYSDSDRDNFDIFLPNWLARYNKVIFTTVYVVGLIVVGYRLLHQG
ncbi:hypothetical protein [Spirosoma arcticum]